MFAGVLSSARGGRAQDEVGDGIAALQMQELRDPWADERRRGGDHPGAAWKHAVSSGSAESSELVAASGCTIYEHYEMTLLCFCFSSCNFG